MTAGGTCPRLGLQPVAHHGGVTPEVVAMFAWGRVEPSPEGSPSAAPGRGTLRAGATAGSWVATYTGLRATDVTKALGGETRVLWLGTNPAAGTQFTIFELPDAQSVLNGMVGGPMATCTAPAEG